MKTRIGNFWRERSQGEKQILGALTVVLLLAAYAWLVIAANRARADLSTSLQQLRSQAARLERDAAELVSLRQRPIANAGPSDLRTLAQSQAGAAGLTRSLQRAENASAGQLQVGFAAAAFADWLVWLKGMQTQQVRLESCRLEAMSSAPGLVSVTATLSRTTTP